MNNITELVFVLDKSGSMRSIETDTRNGFNEVIEQSRAVAKPNTVFITTTLFSDKSMILHKHKDIFDVKPLTEKEYSADGSTALYDAVGTTIAFVSNIYKSLPDDETPSKTILFMATDGKENSSERFRCQDVKKLIADKASKGWTFVYLATGIDLEEAKTIGIDKKFAAQFARNRRGVQSMYQKMVSLSKAAIVNYTADTAKNNGTLPSNEGWTKTVKGEI